MRFQQEVHTHTQTLNTLGDKVQRTHNTAALTANINEVEAHNVWGEVFQSMLVSFSPRNPAPHCVLPPSTVEVNGIFFSFEKSHLIISNANIAKYVFPLSLRFKLG